MIGHNRRTEHLVITGASFFRQDTLLSPKKTGLNTQENCTIHTTEDSKTSSANAEEQHDV